MERILLVGDSHGDLEWMLAVLDFAHERGIKKIVQLGDFGFYFVPDSKEDALKREALSIRLRSHGQELYVVPGNHDNYDEIERRGALRGDQPVAMFERCIFFPRGYAWNWGGKRFLALGGAFSIDLDRRTVGINWWDQETITMRDVELACEKGKVDILLSHDSPPNPLLDEYLNSFTLGYRLDTASRHNRKALEAVVEATRPSEVFHGHYHYGYESVRPDGTIVTGLAHNAYTKGLFPSMPLRKGETVGEWGYILEVGNDLETDSELVSTPSGDQKGLQ